MPRRVPLALVLALLACSGGGRTVYSGGPVVTLDTESRVVEALGVEGERIAVVGSAADVRAWAGDGAREVDLAGAALLPGFIDAHGHFPGAGVAAVYVDLASPPLGDVEDLDQLRARLRERAERTPAGEWIVGWGYDDTLLAERRHPTRGDLDAVSTAHPIALLHVSGHLGVLNSDGLARAGIDAATPDPEGGRIRRGADGEPDGVLEENAIEPVMRERLAPSLLDSWRIVREASRLYLAAGVTTAQNGYAEPFHLTGLSWLARLGLLPLRLVLWPGEEAAQRMLAGDLSLPDVDPLRARVGAVKLVADGSIQGYTGYLSQPYHVPPGDDPAYRGYPRIARDALMDRVARFHRAGWQVAVHGNGDASIDDILDAFESAQRAAPRDDARHVIVHAQMARDDQLDRMAAVGVVPSFFGLHVHYWGDRHRAIFLGPERAARISPAGSALERGLRFTLHCDTPVVPMEPLRAVHVAVNRRSAGGAILGAAQRIDVEAALRAVTVDAARQHFEEDEKGSLEPGKLADLVILSRSPLAVPPETLDEIRVLETIVGGSSAWRAPAAP